MEKVKFNVAVQTYMEVFDYLINNGLFVFDSGKDFLKSRIKIGEYGFMLETQVARNIWDDFKDCIVQSYEEQLEENKFDMNGVYSPWDFNPYKSELGLDGKTK